MEKDFLHNNNKKKAKKHHAVKTLEMFGLEPPAPNRLADWRHCAISTQTKSPSTELINYVHCFRPARRFGVVGSSPDFSRVFHGTVLLGLCLGILFLSLFDFFQFDHQLPTSLNLSCSSCSWEKRLWNSSFNCTKNNIFYNFSEDRFARNNL